MSDAAGSEAESAPPAPNGHAVPVGPQHPLWQRAAGQGPPPPPPKRAKPRGAGTTTTTVMGKFAPISMAALELRARNEFDGASSVGSEQNGVATSGDGSNGNTAKKRSRGADGASRMPGTRDNDDDDFDPLDGGEGDEQNVRYYDETARSDADDRDDNDTDARSEVASGADVVANAAFGGGGAGGGAGRAGRGKDSKRRSGAGRDKDCTTLSVTSDTDDGASITSSQRRNAHCRAFPVSGVDCVGCALPAKVTAVDDFVRASCDKMQEAALFKMAALIYQQKVAEPALAEDVPVPGWACAAAISNPSRRDWIFQHKPRGLQKRYKIVVSVAQFWLVLCSPDWWWHPPWSTDQKPQTKYPRCPQPAAARSYTERHGSARCGVVTTFVFP